MSKKKYKLTVEPITCVHIGTGVQISPLDFVFRFSKQGRTLFVKYSTDSILHRIATDSQKAKEFDRASSSGNLKDMYEFFNENVNTTQDKEYICHVTNEFQRNY